LKGQLAESSLQPLFEELRVSKEAMASLDFALEIVSDHFGRLTHKSGCTLPNYREALQESIQVQLLDPLQSEVTQTQLHFFSPSMPLSYPFSE